MTAKDLMVGDWVFITGNIPRRVLCVDKIMTELVVVHFANWLGFGKVECSKISPIPLTKEILEKNGLACGSEHPSHFKEDNKYALELWANYDGCSISWYIGDGEYLIKNINYVHELQHILRLLNIEKEIEL